MLPTQITQVKHPLKVRLISSSQKSKAVPKVVNVPLTAPFSEFFDISRPTTNWRGSIKTMVTKDPIKELTPSLRYKQ